MNKIFISAVILATMATSTFAATPDTFYAGIDAGTTKVNNLDDDKGSYG